MSARIPLVDADQSVGALHDEAMAMVDEALATKRPTDARLYWSCALENEIRAVLVALQRNVSDATVVILVNSAHAIAKSWHDSAAQPAERVG